MSPNPGDLQLLRGKRRPATTAMTMHDLLNLTKHLQARAGTGRIVGKTRVEPQL
jgi:hypothetical protein